MSDPTTGAADGAWTPAHPHLPPMGRRWLLPLYDPFTRLFGAGAVHRRLLEAADLRPGHQVLEIGCGTGNLALLAKARQPGATVVGLDPDVAALALARRKARRRRLEVRLERGVADELPHADASVDRVLSAFMLHHVPAAKRKAALREVHRVLRPGGELHLVDFGGPDDGLADVSAFEGGTHAHRHVAARRLLPGRRAHRGPHRHGASGPGVAALLRDAGVTGSVPSLDPVRFFGPVTAYRAVR